MSNASAVTETLAGTVHVTHSPGPWEVGYGAHHVWATDHKGKFPVCDIRGWGHLTGKGHGALGLSEEQGAEIQVANAYLIAAAPDMLAALREIQVIAECHVTDLAAAAQEGAPIARMELARWSSVLAAIAKAEGAAS